MNRWAAFGCLLMALAIAMGAFGAHGLRQVLSTDMMAIYEKAVFYHVIHSLAILTTLLLGIHFNIPIRAIQKLCGGFAIGIVLFSGSLYALTMSGERWLGAITPFGGTLWLVCWIFLSVLLLKEFSRRDDPMC